MHGLSGSELALVFDTQVKSKAKQAAAILDIEDLERKDGSDMVLGIL